MATNYCVIENCDVETKPGSELAVCHVCRQSFSYWRKKSPAYRLERKRKLLKFQARLVDLRNR